MANVVEIMVTGVFAYVIGSISFAVLVTRWKAGIDIRTIGSGHASGTNTMRAAGWAAAILVAVLDLSKGFFVVWLSLRFSGIKLTSAVAAGMVVVGHCWPMFAGFRGGMGLASGAGALLAVWPLGFVLALGLDVLLQLVVRHSARANFFTGLLLIPLWALFDASYQLLVIAAAVGVVISIRAFSDWRRVYKELWLDRG
jgi:glycerol-3-phosphate acyltransferase PlsY